MMLQDGLIFNAKPTKLAVLCSCTKEKEMNGILGLLAAFIILIPISPVKAEELNWAGANNSTALPPQLSAFMEESNGKLIVEDFVPIEKRFKGTALTTYSPLVEGSSWQYGGQYVSSEGSGTLSVSCRIDEVKIHGSMSVAGLILPDGTIQWIGWDPTGLLRVYEEKPGEWSYIYNRALYIMYADMDVGGICSGDTRMDVYIEPEHTFIGFGKHRLSHTLTGFATITLPLGTFEECAIFSGESSWVDPGGMYLERGITVLAPNVGRIASRMLEVGSEGGVYWAVSLSFLTSYTIP